jgi:hypothetical protein
LNVDSGTYRLLQRFLKVTKRKLAAPKKDGEKVDDTYLSQEAKTVGYHYSTRA